MWFNLKIISLRTNNRTEFLNITKKIRKIVKETQIQSGICQVYVPHTTAGVTVNESADSAVQNDILNVLEQLVPLSSKDYKHAEGNSDAHIKTLLTGSSVTVPIKNNDLTLGTWQAIFFTEYDGPRDRRVLVTIVAANS